LIVLLANHFDSEIAAGVALTVLMLRAEDLRVNDAFDAAQVRLEAKG
jgi:hypothetical protein